MCVTQHEASLAKLTTTVPPRSAAARAKPTIMVGRFCGRGMGALREGILPFPEAALCFISVGTEMKRKKKLSRFRYVCTAQNPFHPIIYPNKKSDEYSPDFF